MKKKTKSRTAIRSFLLIVAALLISSAAFAQQMKVTGKVVDEQNEPVELQMARQPTSTGSLRSRLTAVRVFVSRM